MPSASVLFAVVLAGNVAVIDSDDNLYILPVSGSTISQPIKPPKIKLPPRYQPLTRASTVIV